MPPMTRQHYNLIADATASIIEVASRHMPMELFQQFRKDASDTMVNAVAGTSSQFKADRFRDRCLGLRKGR